MNAAPCSWRVRTKRISVVALRTSRIGRFIVPGMPNTWSMPSRRRQSTTACAPVIMGAFRAGERELLRYIGKLSRVSSRRGRNRMRVWLAGAIALCLSAAAWAAPLTEDDAVRIGREANVEGLRALVVQHNPVLIYRATASWNFGASRTLPEALEALLVEHYADRAIQRSLLSLLARSIDKYERYPKYRGRGLFDLLHADLKSGKDSHHYAICIIATDLPVEPELVALLPLVDPAAANELVMFLGDRKHAPALAALQALQARIPHERNVNQMLERVDWAYLQIGTPEAVQAFLARMRALGQSKDERAASEVWNMLIYATQQPANGPPDYAELRAALPAELNDSAWDQLIRLVEKRKERRGVP